MSSYPKPKEGEPVLPIMKGYKMACCDCGLVHLLKFEIVKIRGRNRVQFRAWRENGATGQVRRRMTK